MIQIIVLITVFIIWFYQDAWNIFLSNGHIIILNQDGKNLNIDVLISSLAPIYVWPVPSLKKLFPCLEVSWMARIIIFVSLWIQKKKLHLLCTNWVMKVHLWSRRMHGSEEKQLDGSVCIKYVSSLLIIINMSLHFRVVRMLSSVQMSFKKLVDYLMLLLRWMVPTFRFNDLQKIFKVCITIKIKIIVLMFKLLVIRTGI